MIDLETRQRKQAAQRTLRDIGRKERKAAKAKRLVSPKADRGRVRDNGYLAWLRRQPCSVRGLNGHACEGRTEAAHIRTHKPGELPTGLQRKPSDRRCTALCSLAHREQHQTNEARWWASYGLDPFAVAERLYTEYLAASPSVGVGE